jgi:uncharacterized membrane protein
MIVPRGANHGTGTFEITPQKAQSLINSTYCSIRLVKGLLLAKDISPTAKWNEAVKICSSDSRWVACEEALTVGERRQALAEYQTKRANELYRLTKESSLKRKTLEMLFLWGIY